MIISPLIRLCLLFLAGISPLIRLCLLFLAGITPRWQLFFTTSTDYSARGLAMPIMDSIGIACVIVIARTKNPLVDGDIQPPVKDPLAVETTTTTTAISKP